VAFGAWVIGAHWAPLGRTAHEAAARVRSQGSEDRKRARRFGGRWQPREPV